jgi:N-methylhydantoinase B
VDPILVEVVRNRLQAVAEEMGVALSRTAHSVNIRDRKDFSCGVYTPQARLVAQAEHIPLHLGLLAHAVEPILKTWGRSLNPGDILVTNDPYLTGSHLPDVTVLAPAFDETGELIGYVANMAHHVDVGGDAPGSLSMRVRELAQEGLRIPPMLLQRGGTIDESVVRLFEANSRTPEDVAGDVLAQVAANITGVDRLRETSVKMSRDALLACSDDLILATARELSTLISHIPADTFTFTDALEWDVTADLQDLPITVSILRRDRHMIVDFTGTASQVEGPINATRALTLSCVLYAVKTMLAPYLPSNHGIAMCIDLRTPSGSLVDARYPAPVGLCNSITSQRIVDVLLGALGQIVPAGAMAASTGSMNGLIMGGPNPRTGRAYSYVETYGGGQGALMDMDGADGVHTHMTNTSNSPTEMIERAYPLRVLRYALVPDSEGAGRTRGGLGMTREVLLLGPATVSIHLERTRTRPWGVAGGHPALGSSCILVAGGKVRSVPGKATFSVEPGTVLRLTTAGGGGAGDPTLRRPEDVLWDVRNGLITPDRAADVYRVRIDLESHTVDEDGTRRLRSDVAGEVKGG